MHSAKLFLSATALVVAAGCARSDHADTAVAAGASTAQSPAPAASPTLTPAAADTARPSGVVTQSGRAKSISKSPPTAPRVIPGASDTAGARAASAPPAPDTTAQPKPAGAPAPAPQAPASAPPATVATASAAADSLGRAAYETNCRRCHGVRGVPPRTMAAKYPKIPTFDAAFVAKVSADSIVSVLNRGVNDDMKSFRDKLTRDEMRALAVYVRALAR